MRERQRILELWREMRGRSGSGVLVTVVKTLGSSYRRPGARLLLMDDGRRAGSVSGGCLEDDLVKKAWWLTEKGPLIRKYDTTPDGDIGSIDSREQGFGLGCNGIIYLLAERVSGADGDSSTLALLERVHATRKPAMLARVIALQEWVGFTCIREKDWSGGETNPALAERIRAAANDFSDSGVARLNSGEEVFFETLTPPVRLLIFGGGDDAVPLTEFARQLGWQVSVIDGRAHYVRAERFPLANEVMVRDLHAPLDDLQTDGRTAAVVMTHSYSQDRNFVSSLVRMPLAYLGMLGPRSRSYQILRDLAIEVSDVAALYAPVGLDVGADGPEQVALSVIAEIQAAVNGRAGGSLRTQEGSIHSRESDGMNSERRFTPSIVCA